MIKYQGKKYTDINDLAYKLDVNLAMASHLYTVNGGSCDDSSKDLKKNKSIIKVKEVKLEDKVTKEFKPQGEVTKSAKS